MKRTAISLLAGAALLLTACSSDVENVTPRAEESRTLHTAPLFLDGGITRFDDAGAATRATTSDWDDGSTLYLQYQTSNGLVDGTAVYSESRGEWTVNYYGTITKGLQAKCEVYYFENPTSAAMTSVSLNAQSAVFADAQATYLYEDGTVTLRAHLKPQTGRIRFRGTAGYQFSFSGLKWYSGYNITANQLNQQSGSLALTVGQDGYTPYIYGVFTDASTRKLSVDSGEDDYSFNKSFDESVLATGKSGYINVPTMTSRNGWQVVEFRKNFTVTGNGKTVNFKMIKVEAGTFQMGSDSGDSDEKPVHQVTLTKDYFMGETEVTQGLWYAVMGQSPTSDGSKWSSTSGLGDSNPAYYISYEDCQKFLTKLNQLTGQQFRFPTEAEWEYAAKGGKKSQGYTYAGSNTIGDVAWYTVNSYDKGSSNPDYGTHEVKTKNANELGLYDMSGNVREWCADWYGSYNNGSQTDPTGPTSGSCRVFRGGSWYSTATYCRVADRSDDSPSYRFGYLGFRLAL